MIGPRALTERVGRRVRVGDIDVIGVAPQLDAYRLIRRLTVHTATKKMPSSGPAEVQHLVDAEFAGAGEFAVSKHRYRPESFIGEKENEDGTKQFFESLRFEKWTDRGCMFGSLIRMIADRALGLSRRFVMEYSQEEWSQICTEICRQLKEHGEPKSDKFPFYPDGWRKSYSFYAPPDDPPRVIAAQA